jgi:hypothetical protein
MSRFVTEEVLVVDNLGYVRLVLVSHPFAGQLLLHVDFDFYPV